MEEGSVDYSSCSAIQRIELKTTPLGLSLFLDGQCQFTQEDEQIYHESLATLVMVCAPQINNVLICGGGDGLVAREVLRFPVKEVVLCEIDKSVIELAKTHQAMRQINEDSLNNPKLKIVIDDAYNFLSKIQRTFDVIILDFPSPENYDDPNMNRLFSRQFFEYIRKISNKDTVLSAQFGAIYGMDIMFTLLSWIKKKYRFVHYLTLWLAKDRVEEFIFASNQKFEKLRPIPDKCCFLTD
jgi:spermidine synthase